MSKFIIASFDIGKKNFAFYIEEFTITNNTLLDRKNRYNNDGTPTEDMKLLLNSIYKNGKSLLYKNIDLTLDTDKSLYLDKEVIYNMYDTLDKYSSYWDLCDTIIIEQQMSFGKKNNTMALKLASSCSGYFMYKYGRFKNIIEFPSYHKTNVLGAPKEEKKLKSGKIKYTSISQRDRKKWSVLCAKDILKLRNEEYILNEFKKKDDICDTICQLQAFKILYFIDNVKF